MSSVDAANRNLNHGKSGMNLVAHLQPLRAFSAFRVEKMRDDDAKLRHAFDQISVQRKLEQPLESPGRVWHPSKPTAAFIAGVRSKGGNMISASELVAQLQWRYATKQFDATRRISDVDWTALEQSLILAPSSYGLQPWKFVVVTGADLKARLPEAAWGQSQPKDCSHFVVLAARKQTDDGFVDKLIESIAETRGQAVSSLEGLRNAILSKSRRDPAGHFAWNTHQCYIALGFLMQSAAMLGIDACPMEGILPAKMDELLGLTGSEYSSVVACALGYRTASDKYATAAKVRYSPAEVVVRL